MFMSLWESQSPERCGYLKPYRRSLVCPTGLCGTAVTLCSPAELPIPVGKPVQQLCRLRIRDRRLARPSGAGFLGAKDWALGIGPPGNLRGRLLKRAVRRPLKQPVSVHVDGNQLRWLFSNGYETNRNHRPATMTRNASVGCPRRPGDT